MSEKFDRIGSCMAPVLLLSAANSIDEAAAYDPYDER
jgi:hypothetical protein